MKKIICIILIITVSLSVCVGLSEESRKLSVNVCEPGNSLISLEVYKYSQHPSWQYAEMVYDALLLSDYAGTYEYNICTDWKVSEDGLTGTLKIADGVVFQDGSVCDAEDVVATLNFIAENLDTLAMISSVWANLVSAEVIDNHTVKVNMGYKSHNFECALGYTFILSADDLEKYGEAMWAEGVINGTGPWTFVNWVDGQYVEFARKAEYWKDPVSNVDSIKIWYISESNSQISALLSGELDYVSNVKYDLISMLDGAKDLNVNEFEVKSMNYLHFKMTEDSPFNDIMVRKAACHAIDYEALLSLYGGGRVMNCAATKGADGYRDDLQAYEYNPELARQLLSSSNYNGEKIEIWSWTHENAAVSAISAYMEAAGFKMSINLTDSAGFSAIRSQGDYTMFYGGVATWDADLMTQYIVPRIQLDVHKSGYLNEELNALIIKADAENNRANRTAMLEEVIGVLHENYGPITGVLQKAGYEVTRNGLLGVRATGGGIGFYRNVYVDEESWNK